MDNIGGAEIVSLVLAQEFNADIYTTNIDSDKITKMGFAGVLRRIFSIGKVPINAPFRQQLALWWFRKLNLKGKYDFFIIAGDWAVSGAVNNKPNLWYVHSPIREIWDLSTYVRENVVASWQRPLFDIWVFLNQRFNRKYVESVEKILCNSENTKNRVEKYLKRKALVVNPPIETSSFHHETSKGYWLSVNRLIKHKRVDMQLQAFSELSNEKLIIVGSYEKSKHFLAYAEYCRKVKPENVEIKSWVSKDELVKLYANCKGFITTSHDEDFGMNAAEAMAAGKPVIAPNEGGYRETLNHKTGILIENIDGEKLKDAVVKLGKEINASPNSYREACQSQARQFDTKIFIQKIKKVINF